MVKRNIFTTTVETENNNNNNASSRGDQNYIFKNRKIVRIKRSVFIRGITRKNESSVSEDNNIKKKTAASVVHHTHGAVVGGDSEQQIIRLVWIQKRKAVDEHEEGQEFAHYRNKRKRIKSNDSDKTMRADCTFKHKPDYDFIISWF
jgi:hypothetical protein